MRIVGKLLCNASQFRLEAPWPPVSIVPSPGNDFMQSSSSRNRLNTFVLNYNDNQIRQSIRGSSINMRWQVDRPMAHSPRDGLSFTLVASDTLVPE
jgi:hypothetical protein